MLQRRLPETPHEHFKTVKKALNLTNNDIAKIVNQSPQNIKQQSVPGKELGKIPLLINWFYDNYIQEKLKKQRDQDYFIICFLSWMDANCQINEYHVWEYQNKEYTFRQLLSIYRKKINELKSL
jgi:hypothetical protein